VNEAETRAELIDPALAAAGWGVVSGSRIAGVLAGLEQSLLRRAFRGELSGGKITRREGAQAILWTLRAWQRVSPSRIR